MKTPAEFNANPTAKGLKQCGGSSLPPLPANCNVHTDGKLYCQNSANAAMYGATTLGSAVVNRLRSTSSWFTCWGTGQLRTPAETRRGTSRWATTTASWGWVPAVSLSTASTFDANPTAYGLPHCS